MTALNDDAVDRIVLKAATYELADSMCSTLAQDYDLFATHYDRFATLTESALCINRTVTIEAEVSGSVVLDAKGLRRVIHVQSGGTAELIGLNITGGVAAFGGGLVIYPGGVANLAGCNIHDNAAGLDRTILAPGGGGLCILGEASLRDCNIYDNRAAGIGQGGGLRIDGEAKLVNSRIYNNSAAIGGGLAINGVANLEGCSIYSNNALGIYGGGLSISESRRPEKEIEANLVNCKVYQNKALEVQSRTKPLYYARPALDAFPMTFNLSGRRSSNCSRHGEAELHRHSR